MCSDWLATCHNTYCCLALDCDLLYIVVSGLSMEVCVYFVDIVYRKEQVQHLFVGLKRLIV